jgi:hypothetical protein
MQKIDRDCALVPRGALVVDASKRVIMNPYFEGLSYNTAAELRAYLHFRVPESLQGLALLKKPGIIKSGDFLDCITKDLPDGELKHRSPTSAHLMIIATVCFVLFILSLSFINCLSFFSHLRRMDGIS